MTIIHKVPDILCEPLRIRLNMLLNYISLFSAILPVFMFFLSRKGKPIAIDMKLLISLFLITLATEIATYVLSFYTKNAILSTIFTLVEYTLIVLWITLYFKPDKVQKIRLVCIFGYGILFFITRYSGIEPTKIDFINYFTRSIALGVIAILSFNALVQLVFILLQAV